MNRLAPLIVRHAGPRAVAAPLAMPARLPAPATAAVSSDDLKLFATGFLGGLVFFGTWLG